MPARISVEIAHQRFNKSCQKHVIMDFSSYVGYNSKCKFIDDEYGEWWTLPKFVINLKCQHPKRSLALQAKNKIIPINEVKDRILKKHGNIVTIDESSYINISSKGKFIDKKFGEFYSTVKHICDGHSHPKRGVLKYSQPKISSLLHVQGLLKKVHGDLIKIVPETYISMGKKATFVHKKYGLWEAVPNNVITKASSHPSNSTTKAKNTFIKKYGVNSPNQLPEIFKKGQKSRWDTRILYHWKTGKEIICRGSYEYSVVFELNSSKINYEWQIKFILSSGDVYFCDLYLINEDKYIEIKGIFYNDKSRNKWIDFHAMMPNSELWQKDKVVQFTGKSTYRMKLDFQGAANAKKVT